jgi:hypothetical protein
VLTGLQVELFEAIGTVGLAVAMLRVPRRSPRDTRGQPALAS